MKLGRRGSRVAMTVVAVTLAIAGCRSRASAPPPLRDVVGLEAIPAQARVIAGLDVSRLSMTPMFVRAARQLLLRNPELLGRITRLVDACGLDLTTDVQSVLLAGGDVATADRGRPLVMVAAGRLVETDLVSCVRTYLAGVPGGALTATTIGGRTVYAAVTGARTIWFSFGAGGAGAGGAGAGGAAAGTTSTVIVSPSQEWIELALGGGPRIADDPDLAPLIAQAQTRGGSDGPAMWAAGLMAGGIGERLQELIAKAKGLNGPTLQAPPRAVIGTVDVSDGLALAFDAVMTSPEDAATLASFARTQLELIVAWSQIRHMGPKVAKVSAEARENTVTLTAALTDAEVAELLSVLGTVDTKASPLQDAGPESSTPHPDAGKASIEPASHE